MPYNPNRRGFLKGIASHGMEIAATATVGAMVGPPAWEQWWNTTGKEHTLERTQTLRSHIQERYGIEVLSDFGVDEKETLGRDGMTVEMRAVRSDWLVCQVLEKLKDILAIYPPTFLRDRVKKVYITSHVSGEAVGGERNVLGFAGDQDIEPGLLAIVIPQDFLSSYFGVFGLVLNRFVSHHELAHVLTDDKAEEQMSRLHPNVEYHFISWRLDDKDHPPEGFVSTYASSGPAEDLAEVAGALFASTAHRAELRHRMQSDAIVAAKVHFVQEWYERESNGLFNEQYWKDLDAGRVNEQYWDRRNPQG